LSYCIYRLKTTNYAMKEGSYGENEKRQGSRQGSKAGGVGAGQQGLETRLEPKVRVFLLDMYILLYYSLGLSCHVPTAHSHATNGARDSSRVATSLLRTTTRRMPRREATRQIKTERASAEQQGQGQCTGGSRRVSKLRYVFKKNVFCVF
jgi:hypothetical protein